MANIACEDVAAYDAEIEESELETFIEPVFANSSLPSFTQIVFASTLTPIESPSIKLKRSAEKDF